MEEGELNMQDRKSTLEIVNMEMNKAKREPSQLPIFNPQSSIFNHRSSILHPLSSIIAALFAVCLCGSFSFAQSPTLEVYPPDMHLFTARGQQRFIVRAVYPDGLT